MKYSYYDLGFVKRESYVEVFISSSANVHLMDSHNFARYKNGENFRAFGGGFTSGNISFTVPNTGRWYVTIDLGGNEGYVTHSCEVTEKTLNSNQESINWQIQDDNENYQVKTSSRYLEKNPRYGSPETERTDFLIFDKETGKHIHVSADEYGNLKNWHKPKK